MTGTGAALMVLGAVVVCGWFGQRPLLTGMFAGFPPMVITTALMFMASGIAIIALAWERNRFAGALGLGVALAAGTVLAEHLCQVDLGMSLPSLHSWAQDGYSNPGRPSRATASCFVLVGFSLLLLAGQRSNRQVQIASAFSLVILAITLSAGLGSVLRLDALYPSYLLRGMSVPTATGMLILGGCLLWCSASVSPAHKGDGSDNRIVSIGSVLLLAVALVTGVPMLYVVRVQVDDAMLSGIRTAIATQAQLFDTVLTLRMQRAAIIANRPNAIRTLRAIRADPHDAVAPLVLQGILDSFIPHGFSSIRVILQEGRVIASSGRSVTHAEVMASLDADSRHTLSWRDGYFLLSRLDIKDGDDVLAIVEAEQPIPQLFDAFRSATNLGPSGDLELCQVADSTIRCFPGTRRLRPYTVPYEAAPAAGLLMTAAAGGHGIHNGHDRDGTQVLGAYTPLERHRLFLVLKIQSADLYGRLRSSTEIALGLAVLMVVCGSLLFRVLVKPIALALVTARDANAQKTREMGRLHALQRAIFEQAPDGILVCDERGRIQDANERMARLFGYSRSGLQSLHIEDLVPAGAREQHRHRRDDFHRDPETRPMSPDRTLKGLRADGSEFAIEVALAPMTSIDADRVIAIVKDVTETRRAEQLIRDSLKEKEVLLGEIHHRVKNNLQIVQSLLDMQVGLTADASAAGALRDSQNRIQSMALIHQTLYQSQDFAKVDFGHFLEQLMGHLHASYGRKDVQLSSRSERVSLPLDCAIPCGLIVNELVTNALKHAFPDGRRGSVLVELTVLRDVDVEVAVTDDGVGIVDTFSLSSVNSLGMQLVQVLSEQLHAELSIRHRDPTRVAFTFPLKPFAASSAARSSS